MRPSVLALSLLAACDAGSVTIVDDAGDTDRAPAETDGRDTEPGPADTDAADTDVGPVDSDDPVDLPDGDPFGPDPVVWDGLRVFTFVPYQGHTCQVRVQERGEQVYGAGYLQIERACPSCQRVFELAYTPTGLCITTGFAEKGWRGLAFGAGGKVEVFSIAQRQGGAWTAELLAQGTLGDDGTITYTYRSSEPLYRRVDVAGTISLE